MRGVFLILLFSVLAYPLERFTTKTGGTAILFILISISAPFLFILSFFRQILIAIRELKTLMLFSIISGVLQILPIIAIFLTANSQKVLQLIILATVLQSIISSAIAITWLLRVKKREDKKNPRTMTLKGFVKRNWREQFRYSGYLIARLPIALLQQYFDRFLITGLFSPIAFATYTIGAKNIPFLPMFRTSLVNTLAPEISEEYHKTKQVSGKSLEAWRKGIRLTALIIIPVFVFLEIFSYEFITGLYSIKYAEAVSIFRVYLF